MTEPAQSTVERYRDAAIALLPPGEAFSKSTTGPLAEVLEALSVEPARLHEQAERLLENFNPATAVELLPEWEEATGLVARGTNEERQGAIVTRLRGRTSHATSVFEDAALGLGYAEERWIPIAADNAFDAPTQFANGRWRVTLVTKVASGDVAQDAWVFARDHAQGGGVLLTQADGGDAFVLVSSSGFGALWRARFVAGEEVTLDVDNVNSTLSISSRSNGTVVYQGGSRRLLLTQYTIGRHPLYGSPIEPYATVRSLEVYSRSGIEFVTYQPAVAGRARAGDALTNDEWGNVVRMYVPVNSQTADDTLREQFDYLRRAHGFLDIVLEGPMGAERKNDLYYNQLALSASTTLNAIGSSEVRYEGYLSIQAIIDDGAGGAPNNNPQGSWELWASADGITYTRVTNAVVDTELDKIKPNGNATVAAWAMFTGVPGRWVKLRYNATGGVGTTNAKATVNLTLW